MLNTVNLSGVVTRQALSLLMLILLGFPADQARAADLTVDNHVAGPIVGDENSVDGSSGGSNTITITPSGSVGSYVWGSYNTGSNSTGGYNTFSNFGSVNGSVYGSYNTGASSTGGYNTFSNSAMVRYIIGSSNMGEGSTGGSNTINNSGTVVYNVYGSRNIGASSTGGSNTINNSGSVDGHILGSYNLGTNSTGGSNTINNSGSVGGDIYGSYNIGTDSTGSSNTISNSGTVVGDIYGSYNEGANSTSTGNTINNSGSVDGNIYGSYNLGTNSTGGSNTISNSGSVDENIFGSYNSGAGSTGGSNIISNSGTVFFIYGSYNGGAGSTSGSNTISNSGSVDGNIYGSYNSGAGSTGGSNTISNSGTVGWSIYGSVNSGAYSTSTGDTINNSGTVENIYGSVNVGANSTSTGNTINNFGTVDGDIYGSYNDGANSTSSGNTINNSGYVAGDIWGSRNIGTDSHGGDDTITNSGTVAGSIYGEDGNDTIILVGGSRLGGVADGGSGDDTLGFNNMGTVDSSLLGTTYLNFENFGIYGGSNTLTGRWDFSGGTITVFDGNLTVSGTLLSDELFVNRGTFMSIPGTVYSGSTTVDGSMNLNGSLTGNTLTVGSAGFLSGNGMISGDVVNYGTISPGNSIGIINIAGSLSFTVGSTYLVELASGGRSDLILVSGPVSISGGSLQASLPRALYTDGDSWTVINATEGISGSFSSINTNFTSATIDLRQSLQNGSLKLVIDRTPYAHFGITPNEAAVGMGLDELLPSAQGAMANLLMAMDFNMNPSQLNTTLAGLNPEMYTAFPAAGLETATIFSQSVNRHQQESRLVAAFPAEDRTAPLWNAWFRALGSQHDSDSTDDITGYDLSTGGAVFGADRSFGPALRGGLMLGYSDGDLDWDESGRSGQIVGKYLGLYGSTSYNDFYLDVAAGYTSLDNSAERLISTPAVTGSSSVTFDAAVWSGSLTTGYDFKPDSLLVGPVASISYLSLDQDGFSENGMTDFSVTVVNGDAESLISRLGIRLGGLIEGGDWRFLPRGELSWLHQFKDDPFDLTASFAGYPAASFNVSGAAPAADQALLNLGLSAEYGTNLTLYADYTLRSSDEQRSQILSCGLAWLF